MKSDLRASKREDSEWTQHRGARENRPEHYSTSRLAAGRATSGHVTRLVHHRGRRDSEDGPRYSPGPPVGKEEPVTEGGPDPAVTLQWGPGEPRPAKAKGRGTRQSRGSANGRVRCPRLPPPHRIPGARVAFPQAAEAAPARASIRVLARCSPGAAVEGHGGEGRIIPVAAAGSLFCELEVGTAGVKASAGTSPFFLLQTRSGSGRAGRMADLWAAAPHPGTRGMSWPPRAGGCPPGWCTPTPRIAGYGRGRGAAWPLACPSPLCFPPSSSATGRGRGSFFTFLTSPLPLASIKLAAGGSPALWLAPVGRCCLLLWSDWLRT